eukprot:gb/GECH01011151.1/.p1 GENE.gb/GECH01011151.1/~~gb/GECH01011151.1/.p1  ORF type:complete len:264 (+),score=33.92 gb/GECH01011151.1/:1-792(+)
MVRGPRNHLKRLVAPKHWMLDKLGGIFAPRPSQGPHKLRECIPLVVLLRNRMKYAITRREVAFILGQRLVKVDGKVRTNNKFPAGFMDVITIEKSGDHFRLLYDTKGRFMVQKISESEARYKLCRVTSLRLGAKGLPYITTNDGRTVQYPHPDIKGNDTIKLDIRSGKIMDFVKFEVGNLAMVTGGHNIGRIGVITSREKHPGSFDIVHIKDKAGHTFSTRLGNVFVIGKGEKSLTRLPKNRGIKLSPIEDRARRLKSVQKRN